MEGPLEWEIARRGGTGPFSSAQSVRPYGPYSVGRSRENRGPARTDSWRAPGLPDARRSRAVVGADKLLERCRPDCLGAGSGRFVACTRARELGENLTSC